MKSREAQRAYAKEVREWRKAHKMCVRCGKEKALEGRVMCLVCMMDARERHREEYRQMSDEEKLKRAEKKKLIREEKKARRECLQCSRAVYKNHAYCYEHYISQKKAHTRHRRKKYPYHPSGTCRICGKEPVPGHKLCPEHYEQYAERMRELNAQKDRSSHRWHDENKITFIEKGEKHED